MKGTVRASTPHIFPTFKGRPSASGSGQPGARHETSESEVTEGLRKAGLESDGSPYNYHSDQLRHAGMWLYWSLFFQHPGMGGGDSMVPEVARVFLVVEENHSYGDVISNPNMPYFNSLVAQGGLATQYYANAHPSLPNYFMLTTGMTITSSNAFSGTVTQDNVVRALTSAGKTWKCYAESLPSPGYLGGDVGPYLRHHVPFVYFSDVENDPAQAGNIVPFSELAGDLAGNHLPDYAIVVPNIYDDANSCPGGATSCTDAEKLASLDQWLKTNLAGVIDGAAVQNLLMIITFDESQDADTQNGGGHVATVILGARVKPGYRSVIVYLHPSTLRLTLKALGVSDLPAAAAGATDMGEFFK